MVVIMVVVAAIMTVVAVIMVVVAVIMVVIFHPLSPHFKIRGIVIV
jgi:hypothetical protein